MSVLNHIAQVAAVILLIEVIVVVVILLAVAGGLAFGLRWVRKKTDWAFNLVNSYTSKGTGLVRKGTDYAALPFIKATGVADRADATVHAIREEIRRDRDVRVTSVTALPAESVEEPEAPVPLV